MFSYDFGKAQCGRFSWELTGRAQQIALSLLRLSWRKLLARTLHPHLGAKLSGQELKKLGRIEGDISEALELLSNQVLNQAQVGAAKIKLRAGSAPK
jgi:hypothetical protein